MKKEIHKSRHKPSMLTNAKDRRRRVIPKLELQLKSLIATMGTKLTGASISVARIKKELAVLKTRI